MILFFVRSCPCRSQAILVKKKIGHDDFKAPSQAQLLKPPTEFFDAPQEQLPGFG